MSEIQFPSPADRIVAAQAPKNQFRIDTSLSDLPFLRQLAVQGRLRYDTFDVSDGNPFSITPQNGTTYFMFKIIIGNAAGAAGGTLTISNDGQDRANIPIPVFGTGNANTIQLDLFDSLVGDEIKSIVFTVGSGTFRTSVFGWNENTSRIRDVTT